jgi:hypothetical protein
VQRQIERLASAGIQLLSTPEIATHYVFERDGIVALVERTEAGFGAAGSAGLLTGHGMAVLVWREGAPFFVARGFEQPASADQVEKLRAFSTDLAAAL